MHSHTQKQSCQHLHHLEQQRPCHRQPLLLLLLLLLVLLHWTLLAAAAAAACAVLAVAPASGMGHKGVWYMPLVA
jgi:hypothetical protein